jgi:hypothetical protein
LPGVTRVIPEEDLLQCGRQGSHIYQLASMQPRESWLAGRVNSTKIRVSTGTKNKHNLIARKKERELKANIGRRLDDMPVAHLHDATAHRGGLGIVSDHYDGLIEPVI